MAVPTIPYLLPVLVKLIQQADTDAGDNVGANQRDAQGRQINLPRIPNVVVRYDPAGTLGPGAFQVDTRLDIARVQIECRAVDYPSAWYLNNQVRDVFLPPEEVAEGYYGTVDGVTMFGTRLDMPAREDTDDRNISRVVCSYLLYYHREELP
jgi:hypothetical protein